MNQAVNLINAVKKLGFYPKERRAKDVDGQNECELAHNIRMAHKNKLFTPAQLTELFTPAQLAALQKLVDETRRFGRLPKQKKGDSAADRYEKNLYM